jgi:hypothetical protein
MAGGRLTPEVSFGLSSLSLGYGSSLCTGKHIKKKKDVASRQKISFGLSSLSLLCILNLLQGTDFTRTLYTKFTRALTFQNMFPGKIK